MNKFWKKKIGFKGFTLIELLIIISIIGILSAIAISHFSAAKRQAWNSASKSALKNAYDAAQAFYVDSPGGTLTTAALQNYGYSPEPYVNLTVVDGSMLGLSMTASYNQSGAQTYTINFIGSISP
jgi:prepilin-type N-terminal cleavage/methylation domain-containing protein